MLIGDRPTARYGLQTPRRQCHTSNGANLNFTLASGIAVLGDTFSEQTNYVDEGSGQVVPFSREPPHSICRRHKKEFARYEDRERHEHFEKRPGEKQEICVKRDGLEKGKKGADHGCTFGGTKCL